MKRLILAAGLVGLMVAASGAQAAEPIVGTWLRPSTGTLVTFSGSGNFCGTVQNGEHQGKSIGCLSGSGSSYEGSITDLANGKKYSGKATVNGNSMELSGCVLGGLICRGETWTRR